MSFFRFRRKKDPSRNYLNRMAIGLGAGLVKARDVILNPDFGPQGAMDVLSTWMGQEIAKELLNQKVITPSSTPEEVLEKLLEEVRIAEDLSVEMEGDTAHVVVQNCLICPRKVGGYDLEGNTACPVGGLVRGAIGLVSGKTPQLSKIDLKTGEICKTDFTIS
ncbi:hypothetical protein EU528_09495 [Candidatus Thorarchaeota archaeon]|nr:MAG: hypothetical protein EU528_09495 [Candidatus Thorarchaeota archaeon]